MAAFVDGVLAPEEIAVVASHLVDCEECRFVVAETGRFEGELEPAPIAVAKPRRVVWAWAAAAVLALLFTVPLIRNRNATDSSIAHLVRHAPPEHRRVEPRLAGFGWAPLQPLSRGAVMRDPADLKLDGAVGDVLEATKEKTDAASRHAAGVGLLLIDQRAAGIAALEQAAGTSSDAKLWSDLAAARYLRATADAHAALLPQALVAADRAIALEARLAEAHFNRALIVEQLGLKDEAREEWRKYLEIDPGSDWSREALAHLRALDRPDARLAPADFERGSAAALVLRSPQDARSWGETLLLLDWANADEAGDAARATARLELVAAIADELRRRSGEQLLADAVAAIRRAPLDARAILRNAQRGYVEARRAHRDFKFGAAEKRFREVDPLFRRSGSPLADVAAYYAATAAFSQDRRNESAAELRALLARIDSTRYRALAAQIHWQLATVANGDRDWGTALREADASSAAFQALGEREHAAFVDSIAAYALDRIGDREGAWIRRMRAFGALPRGALRNRAIQAAAVQLTASGQAEAALAIIDAAVREARNPNPADVAIFVAEWARAALRAGDAQRAAHSLAEARRAVLRIEDPALRDFADAYVAMTEGAVRRDVAALDRAIRYFAAKGAKSDLAEAYLHRARAHHHAGHVAAARNDYAAVLDSLGTTESLDASAQAIDEGIALELAEGSAEAAFRIARRRHGAGLPSRPIPNRVAFIEYAVLPHALAVFCATRDATVVETVNIEREELASRVAAFADAIRRRAEPRVLRANAIALHDVLVAPVRDRIAGIDELVFVADRELHGVPFAALIDGTTSRHLVEDFTIRFSTGASGEAVGGGRLAPAIVIADPSTPRWPRLAASREEARRIAALHGAAVIEGDAATRERFIEAVETSALVHYSGHADSDASSYGALLLAGDDGILGASDIARLDLPLRPLVVLAACGTFRGDMTHVEGMKSIARAFLEAGAREVVGALWEIEDDVSAALFSRFHEHLRTGVSPARALRSAQLDMLRSGNPRLAQPASWSAAADLINS